MYKGVPKNKVAGILIPRTSFWLTCKHGI